MIWSETLQVFMGLVVGGWFSLPFIEGLKEVHLI